MALTAVSATVDAYALARDLLIDPAELPVDRGEQLSDLHWIRAVRARG